MEENELKTLLQAPESERLEFKPRLSAKNRKSKKEADLKAKKETEHRILKSIAGFLNCVGGTLVVGVDNHGGPNGKLLEGFQSADEAEVHLTNLLVKNLGPLAAAHTRVTFHNVNEHSVLVIECPFSADVFPVYVSQGQTASDRILYVRVNNSTREYSGEDQIKYIDFIRKRHTQTSGTSTSAQRDSTVVPATLFPVPKELPEKQHMERKAPLRIVYLQARLSVNGRNALKGRALYDRFSEMSDDALLAHIVLDDMDAASYRDLQSDIISHSQLRQFEPSVIYIEGGLFTNTDGWWKVPISVATEFCQSGGVVIVADVDHNELYQNKAHYLASCITSHRNLHTPCIPRHRFVARIQSLSRCAQQREWHLLRVRVIFTYCEEDAHAPNGPNSPASKGRESTLARGLCNIRVMTPPLRFFAHERPLVTAVNQSTALTADDSGGVTARLCVTPTRWSWMIGFDPSTRMFPQFWLEVLSNSPHASRSLPPATVTVRRRCVTTGSWMRSMPAHSVQLGRLAVALRFW